LYSGSTIASQPTSPLLTTIPTGIPKSPRRWFRYSTFDHQSHQEMACVRCHGRAKTSTQTRDVLSPDLNWKMASGELVSCADCHRPKDEKGGGAKTNCVECHLFHEPSTLKASVPKDLLSTAR
ncbi:MAG TPA: cytochrome c3 family protein, partial [Humisphaera sp.]|nr:cytochrome c3 family protein [Humisphaera sp.]